MFYIQGCGIPGAVLGVGVLVERGFSGLSGLSGLLGLPSFTPGAQVGSAIFLHPRHRWIEAGNRCLAARATHQRMDQVLCAVLCPTAEAPPPEEGCRFGWSRSRARCPKDGFPLACRRSEPLSDHSGKIVGHEKDDSFEMPCACRRWRMRWMGR